MKTPGERIRDWFEDHDIKMKDVQDILHIDSRTLNRLASGEITTVNSAILIAAAKYFDVSADYLLGLSPSKQNNIGLSELRLSEEMCQKLARKEIDGETLSLLMKMRSLAHWCLPLSSIWMAQKSPALQHIMHSSTQHLSCSEIRLTQPTTQTAPAMAQRKFGCKKLMPSSLH